MNPPNGVKNASLNNFSKNSPTSGHPFYYYFPFAHLAKHFFRCFFLKLRCFLKDCIRFFVLSFKLAAGNRFALGKVSPIRVKIKKIWGGFSKIMKISKCQWLSPCPKRAALDRVPSRVLSVFRKTSACRSLMSLFVWKVLPLVFAQTLLRSAFTNLRFSIFIFMGVKIKRAVSVALAGLCLTTPELSLYDCCLIYPASFI